MGLLVGTHADSRNQQKNENLAPSTMELLIVYLKVKLFTLN
ncbi:MAG: hypothetical protein ACOX3A_08370 [bacterium]